MPQSERFLSKLQSSIRQGSPRDANDMAGTRLIPPDLNSGQRVHITLSLNQAQLIDQTVEALSDDIRFEHLRGMDIQVWRFAAQCLINKSQSHVEEFISKFQQEPARKACYFPVENLKVKTPIDFMGVRLLPPDSSEIPTNPLYEQASTAGCFLIIWTEGTDYAKMASRARQRATMVLRALRITLRDITKVTTRQLRFRIGESYLFDDRHTGFVRHEGRAYDIELVPGHTQQLSGSPLSAIGNLPAGRLTQHVDLAMRWIERSWFTEDPVSGILYLFFALESMLGDKSENLKSYRLAFRQAMLSHIANGNFEHPDTTVLLYDEVRSVAVHGGEVLGVDWDLFNAFSSRVGRTLKDYIVVIGELNLTSRGDLIRKINGHEDCAALIAWIRANADEGWSRFTEDFQFGGNQN